MKAIVWVNFRETVVFENETLISRIFSEVDHIIRILLSPETYFVKLIYAIYSESIELISRNFCQKVYNAMRVKFCNFHTV